MLLETQLPLAAEHWLVSHGVGTGKVAARGSCTGTAQLLTRTHCPAYVCFTEEQGDREGAQACSCLPKQEVRCEGLSFAAVA